VHVGKYDTSEIASNFHSNKITPKQNLSNIKFTTSLIGNDSTVR